MYLCVAHCSVFDTVQVRAWVLSVGFTLSFGSMFSKIWTVHQLTTTRKKDHKVGQYSHFLFPQASLSNRDFFLWEIWVTVLQDSLLSQLFNSGDKTVCYQHFIFRCVIFQEIHGDNAFLLSEQFIVVQFIIMLISHCL